MRQALNNIQATHSGLGVVNAENVFKVCDEPHPLLLTSMLDHCIKREIDEAIAIVIKLYRLGYASEDIIQNIFRYFSINFLD